MRRGQPSEHTQDVKSDALLRSHTMGYPGEIHQDNAVTERINDFRDHYDTDPTKYGMSPGRAVPILMLGEDIMPNVPWF